MRKRLSAYLITLLLASVLLSTSLMIIPAAVGSDQSDLTTSLLDLLEQLAEDVSNKTKLPFEAFEHKIEGSVEGKRGALVNKIGAVINQIEAGAFEGAVNKLTNDIKGRIKQWLVPPWENELIEKVDYIIDVIERVLPPPPPISPVASFVFTPETPLASEVVTFNASESYDLDGYIVSYAWEFGDENVTTLTSPIVTHAYATYGTYTVTLTVTDNDTLTDTTSKSIKVIAPPTASFTYSPLAPLVDEIVTFNATSSTPNGGEIVRYAWDLGDNTIRFGDIVTHAYNAEGTYMVVLNVTDSEGLWDIATANVTVYPSVVIDTEPPTIIGVLRSPETPNYDEHVTVMATVIDVGSDVKNVTLSYSMNTMDWVNVKMELVEGFYTAEIPPKIFNTSVDYKVYAYDNAGNPPAVSQTYSYTVTDRYRPIIGVPTWKPEEPFVNENVNVNVTVSEPVGASGVKNVTLWHNATGEWQSVEMTETAGGNWTATIPRQSGGVTVAFYVESRDNAGNSAETSTYGYTVKTPVGWPLALLAGIGLGIAALTATAIYALYRRRKRSKVVTNPGNKSIVTLYIPASILRRFEIKPLKLRKTQDSRQR